MTQYERTNFRWYVVMTVPFFSVLEQKASCS
jgi:hypothetical protein